MTKAKILKYFSEFIKDYDCVIKDEIWSLQSQEFRDFWNDKVLNKKVKELGDFEIDKIVKILDKHGKGNTAEDEAVAGVMIAQGAWRRMFNGFKEDSGLANCLNSIFIEKDDDKKINAINKLYKYNEGRGNSLTGQSGNAINTFLFVYNPKEHISVVSLKDRIKLINFLNISDKFDHEKYSLGEKIVISNRIILNELKEIIGSNYSSRTLSMFLYLSSIKDFWRDEDIGEEVIHWGNKKRESIPEEKESDLSLFYMESQLEDFLIENWEKTELGKKYDLIVEDGEMVSQQYKTGVGKIDILVKDKKDKKLVVIELKKNQTCDDTVGQIARYMGWIEENKTKKSTKGIIIVAQNDKRLYYALKKIKDVEIYLYRVDFKLEKPKDKF
ncbi:MAG: PDDEXK nuclease domain-containing protein [Patescibacteria group bacterium]